MRLSARRSTMLALASAAVFAGCAPKAPPSRPTRMDEALGALGAGGFRLDGAKLVIEIAPASILGSRFYRGLVAALGDKSGDASTPHGMLRDRTGLDLSDVEAVVFTSDPERNTFLLAAATRSPARSQTWLDGMSRLRGDGRRLERLDEFGGVEVFAPPEEPTGAVAFPAPQLVAAGSTAELRRAILGMRAGTPVPYRKEIVRLLSGAPVRADVLVAAVPTPKLMQALTGTFAGPGVLRVPEGAEGVLIAATARESVEVEVRIFMLTASDAEAAREEAREALRELKGKVAAAAGVAAVRPLVEIIDEVQVGGTGATAVVRVDIPARAIAPLVHLWSPGPG